MRTLFKVNNNHSVLSSLLSMKVSGDLSIRSSQYRQGRARVHARNTLDDSMVGSWIVGTLPKPKDLVRAVKQLSSARPLVSTGKSGRISEIWGIFKITSDQPHASCDLRENLLIIRALYIIIYQPCITAPSSYLGLTCLFHKIRCTNSTQTHCAQIRSQ